jgi:hypothetical protein
MKIKLNINYFRIGYLEIRAVYVTTTLRDFTAEAQHGE